LSISKRILIYLAVAVTLVLGTGLFITQPILFPRTNSKASPERASPANLKQHVVMLSEKFVPRDEAHPGNLNKAADYIRREFENAGAQVTEQPYRVNRDMYRNIIARFGPADGQRVIIGAHYDAKAEGYVWDEAAIVRIPEAEAERYGREYRRELAPGGGLVLRTEADWNNYAAAQKAPAAPKAAKATKDGDR
jgi:hypothetical protein